MEQCGVCKLIAQGAGSLSREGFVGLILREQPHSAGKVLYCADAYDDM